MSALFMLIFSNSYIVFILLFILLGCGNAIIWAALTTLSVELLPASERGTASSIFNFFRFFGYALAPVIIAPIYGMFGMIPLYIIGGFIVMISLIFVQLIKPKLSIFKK
jgi:MFS family permease